MKRIGFAFWALWVTLTICQGQPITSPGWFRMAARQPRPTPALPDLGAARGQMLAPNGLTPSPMGLSGEPATPVAEVITPQIQALADGLQHDPHLIFDYVHDQIRYVLYFGSKKGAALTLLEKSGNDFDQSALLVALLRAAGHTNVGYQFGWMYLPYSNATTHYDLYHWWQLTLPSTNWAAVTNYLVDLADQRGYPSYYAPAGNNDFLLQRTWVVLTNNSTVYNLDPAFKVSEPTTGIALTSALGGTSTTISNGLWSAAGGTSTANYVSGLNEASLRGTLTQYTTNALNYLQNYYPNASVQDILGGWQITAATPDDFRVSPMFPTETWGGTIPILTWANEPTNMMSTLAITFAGTNYQWFMPQLQGQRLALTFDNGGLAQLWQDDALLAQHATSGSSGSTNVILHVHHPDGTWDFNNNAYVDGTRADQVVTNAYQRTNATYALLYAFEPDWGWLRQRQNKLEAYLQQGLTNGSRQVLSESLNVMGLGWMLQTEGVEQMLAGQLSMLPMYYHRLGRMAQESGKGYYVDVYMQLTGEHSSGGDDAAHNQLADNYFDLSSFFASGLEHGIIEQLQNTNLVGASTVKMLQIASTNGQAIYLANSGNWSSIRGSLANYGAGVLDQINAQFIIPGYTVLLPANGSNHVAGAGSWAGYGYEARLVDSGPVAASGMIIAGGYHGGYASDPAAVVNSPYVDLSAQTQPTYYSTTPVLTPAPTGADPVDLANGTFQLESTDLALGQAEPRGISLTRYYNGTRRYGSAGGMTGGWVHNYCVNAATVPAPQAGLGGTTPAQAAPMMAATAAIIALYSGASASPKNWTVTALITKWAVDQLTKGGVSITLGKDTLQFIQQPNGVYTPPANCTWTLSNANGAYTLQQRHGNAFKFDALGRLTNIVDQYGQGLAVAYNASNWVQTVTDWKGRYFTFNYTGTPQQLTSVSDGTRTVSYGYSTTYSPQGDLVSITDPENKTSTYVYDTNHQITATLDALSRLVVSNVYDTQGHVTTQYTQGDTNKTWRVFWSGWFNAAVDPAGGARYYMFDDQSRLIASWDELLGESATWYDGQNHIIWAMTPQIEYTHLIYDGNHNLVQRIDPLGFTNQFVYDSQNNLVLSIDGRGNANSFAYNSQFSLSWVTNGAGDWAIYSRNGDGSLSNIAEPGSTTMYGYDQWGHVNRIFYATSGGTTILSSEGFLNNAIGDVLSHTNARGFVTSFQYNSRRQLTNTTAPTNVTVKIAFDAVGNQQCVTDARGFSTTTFWSPTRHPTGMVFPATPQGTPATTNLYNNRDWLSRALNPLQQPTVFTNDAAGRQLGVTDPLQRTTRFGYDPDGHRTGITNAALEATLQQWDKRGQLTNQVDPAAHTVKRGYDAAGNQVTLTNRNGKAWQFQFDKANRLTNTITPLLHSTKLAYNNRGLLQSVTKPSTQSATFGYDARGWQTNRTDQVGTTTYQYDPNNNLTNVFENGKTNFWTFDAYDRVSSYRDSDGNLIQYRRDQNGNVTSLIYPGNRTVSYSYDSLNRLTNVTDWASRQTTLVYDLASHLTSITRPNGTVRQINYDAAGETTNIIEKTTTGFPIAFYQLNYDNAARVKWEFGAPLPLTNTAPPTRTMTYNDDNQIATVNGQTLGYDPDGNMTSGPLTNNTLATYGYNARNQLTAAGGLAYAYDPAGTRIAVTNGANVTRFVTDPNAKLSQVLMRVRAGVTNYYIYGPGLLYEITETATTTNTLTYHYDLRGSTIALTDNNGNVTDRVQYSAYGMIMLRGGTNDTPFLYNGRYGVMSDPNGLLCMRARYYNPYLCRFINPDPSRFAGGLNWYCYADGNPVSYLDPFGLSGWTPDANQAENYWMNVAVNGESAGGILGNLQAAGAATMTSFIGFFGAQNVQSHATASGTAAGNGNTGTAALYGAATVGDIGLAALAGWTGGGGAAAKGVRLGDVGWYELGSQTINGDVYRALEAAGQTADKVQLGQTLVGQYGWWKTISKTGELRTTWSDWLQTLPQGPTPGGYVGMLGVRQLGESLAIPGLTDLAGQLQSGSSTGK